jgi:hypothetical protein
MVIGDRSQSDAPPDNNENGVKKSEKSTFKGLAQRVQSPRHLV